MGLFSGLGVIAEFVRQPLENLTICRAANIHRQIVVLPETCLAKELLE